MWLLNLLGPCLTISLFGHYALTYQGHFVWLHDVMINVSYEHSPIYCIYLWLVCSMLSLQLGVADLLQKSAADCYAIELCYILKTCFRSCRENLHGKEPMVQNSESAACSFYCGFLQICYRFSPLTSIAKGKLE